MDREKEKILRSVGVRISEDLKKRAVKSEDVFEGTREKVRDILKSRRLSKETKKILQEAVLENPTMYKKKQEIDKSVMEKISKEAEGIIRDEMRAGRLSPMSRCCILSGGRCRH